MKKMFVTAFAALAMGLAIASCGGSKDGETFLQQYEAIVVQAEEAQQAGDAAKVEELKQQADALIEANSEVGITTEQQDKLGELMGRMVMVELNAAWGISDNDDDADSDVDADIDSEE
ncbi:MAG: hypothetical protein IJT98_01560 [Prevotella sp.]|nr:hypothetical protein [Prevotella sp.]